MTLMTDAKENRGTNIIVKSIRSSPRSESKSRLLFYAHFRVHIEIKNKRSVFFSFFQTFSRMPVYYDRLIFTVRFLDRFQSTCSVAVAHAYILHETLGTRNARCRGGFEITFYGFYFLLVQVNAIFPRKLHNCRDGARVPAVAAPLHYHRICIVSSGEEKKRRDYFRD